MPTPIPGATGRECVYACTRRQARMRVRAGCTLLLALITSLLATGCSATATETLPIMSAYESRFLDDPVFGGRIHVYEGGDPGAKPLVLVHGIDEGGAMSWGPLMERLTDDYHVLAVDLPGFGHSTRGSHFYSPDRYVEVLEHVIDDFRSDAVQLVGHSLGGAVSLRYAAANPERVEHLHIASVAGILHKASYSGFVTRRGEIDGTTTDHADGLFERLGGRLLRKFFRRIDDGPNIAEGQRTRDIALGGVPTRIAAVALLETDFSETLAAIDTPTTVYWGTDDRVTPLRTGRLLASMLPGRDLVLFHGIGHMPMTTAADDFEAELRERITGGQALAADWLPPLAEPGEGTVRCEDETDRIITGVHDRIVIRDCRRVVLDRVTARHIDIERSRVTLREPRILGDDVGLRVEHSDLNITGGLIRGEVAVDVTQTFLDIAGTRLEGAEHAVVAGRGGGSELTFSVTPFVSGDRAAFLHMIRPFHHGDRI